MIESSKIKNDLILILVFIIIAGAVMGFLNVSKSHGGTVVISVDGEELTSFPLDEDTRYVIDGYHGGSNVLVIEDGSAFLESASCPDKLCVHMGKINKVGQSIICLPNKVVIEIRGKENSDYDTVTG